MSYVILSNKLYTSTTIQFNGNADLIVSGDSSSSNIAIGNEQITGAYITQIAWGCEPNAHIQIWRGLELIAVYDSTSWVDYAGNGMIMNNKLERNMSVRFIGGSGYCVMELQKVLNQDMNYSAYPTALVELDFTRDYYRVLDKRYPTFTSIPGASVTGGGGFATATSVDGRIIGPFAANTPPVTDNGLEVWEARTNLLRWSEDFTNAAWAKAGVPAVVVVGDQAIAPNGTLTADRVTWAAGSGTLQYNGVSFTAGQAYTLSCYARAVSGSSTFRISHYDGVTGAGSPDTTVGEVWERVVFTFTPANTGTGNISLTRQTSGAAGDIYLWGFQLEAGSFPTPYIPTTTAAATRTALVPVVGGLASLLGAQATVFAEFQFQGTQVGNRNIFSVNDTTKNNRLQAYQDSLGLLQWRCSLGSVDYTPAATATTFTTNVQRVAMSVGSGVFRGAINGTASADTAPPSAPALTRLNIGTDESGGNPQNGRLRKLIILPNVLSDAQLQALTA